MRARTLEPSQVGEYLSRASHVLEAEIRLRRLPQTRDEPLKLEDIATMFALAKSKERAPHNGDLFILLDTLPIGNDNEFEIEGVEGCFRLQLICDGDHVWCMDVDSDIWFEKGIHIGDGPCSPGCLETRRDLDEIQRLLREPEVVCHGFTWKLGASENHGEPQYISETGWIVRENWATRAGDERMIGTKCDNEHPWCVGLNGESKTPGLDDNDDSHGYGYHGFNRWFATFDEAAKFLAEQHRREKV